MQAMTRGDSIATLEPPTVSAVLALHDLEGYAVPLVKTGLAHDLDVPELLEVEISLRFQTIDLSSTSTGENRGRKVDVQLESTAVS